MNADPGLATHSDSRLPFHAAPSSSHRTTSPPGKPSIVTVSFPRSRPKLSHAIGSATNGCPSVMNSRIRAARVFPIPLRPSIVLSLWSGTIGMTGRPRPPDRLELEPHWISAHFSRAVVSSFCRSGAVSSRFISPVTRSWRTARYVAPRERVVGFARAPATSTTDQVIDQLLERVKAARSWHHGTHVSVSSVIASCPAFQCLQWSAGSSAAPWHAERWPAPPVRSS